MCQPADAAGVITLSWNNSLCNFISLVLYLLSQQGFIAWKYMWCSSKTVKGCSKPWQCVWGGRSQAQRCGWGHPLSRGLGLSCAAASGGGKSTRRDNWLVCWNYLSKGGWAIIWLSPRDCRAVGPSLLSGVLYGWGRKPAHQQGSQKSKFLHWMLLEGLT